LSERRPSPVTLFGSGEWLGGWSLRSIWLTGTGTAYAVYFDHKRRTDPEFRKSLKRESRRQARAAREEAEAQGAQQKEAIKRAVTDAMEEGFPTDVEEKEEFFMNEVARGERLCQGSKLNGYFQAYTGHTLMMMLPRL